MSASSSQAEGSSLPVISYSIVDEHRPTQSVYGLPWKTKAEAVDFLRGQVTLVFDRATPDSSYHFVVRDGGSLHWIPDIPEVWRTVMNHHVRKATEHTILDIVVELRDAAEPEAAKDEPADDQQAADLAPPPLPPLQPPAVVAKPEPVANPIIPPVQAAGPSVPSVRAPTSSSAASPSRSPPAARPPPSLRATSSASSLASGSQQQPPKRDKGPKTNIGVKGLDGNVVEFSVFADTPISKIYSSYARHKGVNLDTVLMTYDDWDLFPDMTVEQVPLPDKAVLDVVAVDAQE